MTQYNMIPLKHIKPPSLVTLFMLGNSLFAIADGCLRRSSTKTDQEGPEMVERSTVSPSHKLPCLAEEMHRTNCLNEGECFAILTYNSMRETGCSCGSNWEGKRCELAFIDPDILAIQQRNIRTAHMAATVSVCILVFFIILVSVYVYIKFKRKSHLRRESSLEGLEVLRSCKQPTQISPSDSPVHIKMNTGQIHESMCHQTNNDNSPLIKQNKKGPDKSHEALNGANGNSTSNVNKNLEKDLYKV